LDASTGELLVDRRISDYGPAAKGGQKRGRQEGAKPDVLSFDGKSIFMRQARFDLSGQSLPGNVVHLFSSAGFLDDSWWHRTYWQIGTDMGSGYGGWWSAARRRISGRILAYDGKQAFGFGRTSYSQIGGHPGIQAEHRLFAVDISPKQTATAPDRRRGKSPKSASGSEAHQRWSEAVPLNVRAMTLAGPTLFIAGAESIDDFNAQQPAKETALWAVSAEDGKREAEYDLSAAPVFDGSAVSNGHLYMVTADGRVSCWQQAD
jgi:hypothetical protein